MPHQPLGSTELVLQALRGGFSELPCGRHRGMNWRHETKKLGIISISFSFYADFYFIFIDASI